jgi:hypothetical protein
MPGRPIILAIFLCLFLWGLQIAQGQSRQKQSALYFISDCQQPVPGEQIIFNIYNNIVARDTLFREIENKNEGFVFMLGDLVGVGSNDSNWRHIDAFLSRLHVEGTKVYGIPGNHEFLLGATHGINNFRLRFPDLPLTGYCVLTDSMAILMLNSNFGQLKEEERKYQQQWYLAEMDLLDKDVSVKVVIVCTHHSPFSNSKIVGSSVEVQEAFVPRFESSPKARLFLTGHSHNLECFDGTYSKRFLVIGGGGGFDQPLYTGDMEKHKDLLSQADKPRFFYVVLQRWQNVLNVTIRGYSKELLPVPEIKLSL